MKGIQPLQERLKKKFTYEAVLIGLPQGMLAFYNRVIKGAIQVYLHIPGWQRWEAFPIYLSYSFPAHEKRKAAAARVKDYYELTAPLGACYTPHQKMFMLDYECLSLLLALSRFSTHWVQLQWETGREYETDGKMKKRKNRRVKAWIGDFLLGEFISTVSLKSSSSLSLVLVFVFVFFFPFSDDWLCLDCYTYGRWERTKEAPKYVWKKFMFELCQ